MQRSNGEDKGQHVHICVQEQRGEGYKLCLIAPRRYLVSCIFLPSTSSLSVSLFLFVYLTLARVLFSRCSSLAITSRRFSVGALMANSEIEWGCIPKGAGLAVLVLGVSPLPPGLSWCVLCQRCHLACLLRIWPFLHWVGISLCCLRN